MGSQGYKHTEKAKKKIGLAQIGNKRAEGNGPNKNSFKKGRTPWNKGKNFNINS